MDKKLLDSIAMRAHYLATQMIWLANNRADKQKGDPKVGGHPSASASALHIMGAIHLVCKTGFDHIANKPHASPTDHAYNYLLNLFLKDDLSKFNLDEANVAMQGLRAFSKNGEPVFQSYHSAFDPDHHNFFPSGTVGIPPVNAGYMALAYRYAQKHNWKVPENAHFWSLMGDAEYREGSLFEAMPDFAERELGNLTWIVDYNRQSLDGHRLTHKEIMGGTDDQRIERTALANGWEVINLRHGGFRENLFSTPDGDKFKKFLEDEVTDFELNAYMQLHKKKTLKDTIGNKHPNLKKFLMGISDDELFNAFHDMGGHDFEKLVEAFEFSKKNQKKPTLVIAHTIKGWGLRCAAVQGNHSMLPEQDEVDELRNKQGISEKDLFARFADNTPEGKFLKIRSEQLYKEIKEQHKIKETNLKVVSDKLSDVELPNSFDINLKMASFPHTQWMLGQITSKITRIANTSVDEKKLEKGQKALDGNEKIWKIAAEQFVFMAPDVGTSTNLNPSMDGKIFNPQEVEDFEAPLGIKDKTLPDLIPGEQVHDRFLRFDITEANTTSCQGSIGKMKDALGIPVFPLMTVYDFFVKRALDQFFYNLYWKSSFLLAGTPSGVSLSPEGAQHGWKSDFQIPNQIVWEPFYCVELDWIIADALKRHMMGNNDGRTGVHLRLTTRGVEQKEMMQRLRRHRRFKSELANDVLLEGETENTITPLSDEEILAKTRMDCLSGAYYLIDYRGYKSYEPGDNVVNIFAMGTLGTEALKASDELLKRGIYANVVMITSPDLLIGNLGAENEYFHLRNTLGVNGNLHLEPTINGKLTTPEIVTLSGRRVPIVSVHDGEPGLLDNIGSIIGTRHETLAVRKHSKCGRPDEVYAYHHIDAASVVEACGKVLSETALEQVTISRHVIDQVSGYSHPQTDWRALWPKDKEKAH